MCKRVLFSDILPSLESIRDPVLRSERYNGRYLLNWCEFNVYSQSGEDGIIDWMFKRMGAKCELCCEFGAQDGVNLSNTKLLYDHGAKRFLFDKHPLGPDVIGETITPSNINVVFKKYDVPYSLDVLSIDIDSDDYWAWHALSEQWKPRVVIIEFSSMLGYKNLVFPKDGIGAFPYFGSGCVPLVQLGNERSYSLLHMTACNLIFIANEWLFYFNDCQSFLNDVKVLFKPPRMFETFYKQLLDRHFIELCDDNECAYRRVI